MKLSRRGLIVSGLAAGGGLAVAYGLDSLKDGDARKKFATTPEDYVLHAYVKVNPDGKITIAVPQAELGQGVTTAIPMLVAEELDANWDDVMFELSPLDKDYGSAVIAEAIPKFFMSPGPAADMTRNALYNITPLVGLIITGGSSSVLGNFNYLRMAGAATRSVLVKAAAEQLDVPARELTTANSRVIHAASGRELTYGELAEAAAAFKPDDDSPLKDASEFSIIGTPRTRLDTPMKVDGSAVFGIDVKVPGMVYAAIKHGPVFGSTVQSFDAGSVSSRPGVITALKAADNAVAVLAENTWAAQQAVLELAVEWDEPAGEAFNSDAALETYATRFDAEDVNVLKADETFDAAMAGAAKTVEAIYETPYLAHICMEPMGCTALYEESETGDPEDAKLTVWSPSQSISMTATQASNTTGVKKENITVYATLMGGGFGRRADFDFVRQVASLAQQMPGTPIKLTWSREEDVQQDTYRPATVARFRAGLDDAGKMTALDFVIVGKPVSKDFNDRNGTFAPMDAESDSSMIMPMSMSPYGLPAKRLALNAEQNPVPNGNWRSVSMSHNGFYQEAFMNEVAEAAGQDPIDFRISLLTEKPEYANVLKELRTKSGWDAPLAPAAEAGAKRGRGIAFLEAFASIIGQVIEVTVSAEGNLKVDRVVTVVDPHTAVNPSIIEAQIESAVIDGLSAALWGKIDVEDGRVVQSNFHDYRLMKLAETPPVVETHIFAQGGHPGGMGEVGLPAIAPALTAAIYDATGERVRKLPVALSGQVSV